MISQADINKVTDLYFHKHSCSPSVLYSHLHNGYDSLIQYVIPDIVKSNKLSWKTTELDNDNSISTIYHFKVNNINVRLPCDEYENNYITPEIARKRKLSYLITLFGDFYLEIENRNNQTLEVDKETILLAEQNILCKLPCMVKSKSCCLNKFPDKVDTECNFDEGGYFILNGAEKVIMTVESPVYNKILFTKRDDKYESFIYSQLYDISKVVSVHIYFDEKSNIISIYSRTLLKEPMPLLLILKAIDYFETDKSLNDLFCYHKNEKIQTLLQNFLYTNFLAIEEYTKEEIIDQVYTNLVYYRQSTTNAVEITLEEKQEKIKKQLFETILHCEGIDEKIFFLIRMVNQLFHNLYFNHGIFFNKDEYSNKRFDTAAFLISQLFKQQYSMLLRNIGFKFQFNKYDYKKIMLDYKHSTIDNYIITGIRTGTWGNFTKNKKGISRLLDRLSFLKCISSLRDIIVTSNDDGAKKNIAMRSVEPSQSGFVCVVQTPEGEKVGMTKSLTMLATVTNYDTISDKIIKDYITQEKENMNIIRVSEYKLEYHHNFINIYLNGSILGLIDPNFSITFYESLKEKKLVQEINKFTSIVFDISLHEIQINTQKGRLVRPVLRVNKETYELYLKKDMLEDISKYRNIHEFMLFHPYVIEFIDVYEQQFIMIAEKLSRFIEEREKVHSLRKKKKVEKKKTNIYEESFYVYDYVEFHPSLLLGLSASTIPYLSMNQSPRNTYHSVHAKQAIGIYNSNYRYRMDTGHILHNPQRPLVIPHNLKYTKLDQLPYGQNIVLAIMSFSGYNQEDSIIMNKSSIEMGMFQCVSYKDFESVISKNHFSAMDDINIKPHNDMFDICNNYNYDTLQSNGFPELETSISKNDAIIGKVAPVSVYSDKSKNRFKDRSIIYKDTYNCKVDSIENTINSDGYHMSRLKLRHLRIGLTGDKYTSRHGQKSTCGLIIDKTELPVSKEGIVPDIIINPHAIPSRMTIGQIMEMITGKVGALEGTYIDGTPFEDINMEEIRGKLKNHGYREDGTDQLYNGATGQAYESPIYMGPCFYIKLKQLVSDKIHARSIGAYNQITRQPPQGKARNGGGRMGEMEKDCLIAHGISSFMKERFVQCSDKYQVHVCEKCGLFASKVKNHNYQYWCKSCDSYNNIYKIKIPYALKLVVQELRSINIGMYMNIE